MSRRPGMGASAALLFAAAIAWLLGAARDWTLVTTADEHSSTAFYTFFNIMSATAFLPGSLILMCGPGELQAKRAALALLIALPLAATVAVFAGAENPLALVVGVAVSVALCLPARALTVAGRLFWGRVFPSLVNLPFVIWVGISPEGVVTLQWAYALCLLGLALTMALLWWCVDHHSWSADVRGYHGDQATVAGTSALMVVASLGTLHLFVTQALLLKGVFGHEAGGVVGTRIAAYLFAIATLPVSWLVAGGRRASWRATAGLMTLALLLTVLPAVLSLGMAAPYLLCTASVLLTYASRFLLAHAFTLFGQR